MNPDKLFNYLDGKLSPTEREKLEDELIRDPDLQRQFAMARKIHERMSGNVREVILDEPASEGSRARKIMRRVVIVFVALIFLNTLVGVIVIGLIESKRRQTRIETEHNRQDVTVALQNAAAKALPTPSLAADEITIPTPVKDEDAMVEKISASAKDAGGSAVKNLSNESGILVFAEIPSDHVNQFRDALKRLGAKVPEPSSASPGGNAILQIRIVPRTE